MLPSRLTRWLVLVSALAVASSAHAAELLGKDRMFIRFANLRPDDSGILVRLNIVPNDEQPFSWTGKTVYVGADGEADQPDASRFLPPGQSTPWVDVGQYMNKQGTRSWATYLSPLLCGVMTEPARDGLFLVKHRNSGLR